MNVANVLDEGTLWLCGVTGGTNFLGRECDGPMGLTGSGDVDDEERMTKVRRRRETCEGYGEIGPWSQTEMRRRAERCREIVSW